MGMLDRYKKKGGFLQLLNLLESSGKTKQDQLLSLIGQESVAWEKTLRAKMISFEGVFKWEDQYLVEVLTRVQPLTLAVSLHGQSSEELENNLRLLSQMQRRKIIDLVGEKNPTAAEKATCMMKLVGEVRGLVQQGIIKLEKVDANLFIPENIEEQIANMPNLSNGDVGAFQDSTTGTASGNLHSIANQTVQANYANQNLNDESSAKPADGSSLRFHLPNKPNFPLEDQTNGQGSKGSQVEASLRDDVESLKKRLNIITQENLQLRQEMAVLRQENSVMRTKLEQIKKIA